MICSSCRNQLHAMCYNKVQDNREGIADEHGVVPLLIAREKELDGCFCQHKSKVETEDTDGTEDSEVEVD